MVLWDFSLRQNALQKWKSTEEGPGTVTLPASPHVHLAVKGNYDNEERVMAEVDQP